MSLSVNVSKPLKVHRCFVKSLSELVVNGSLQIWGKIQVSDTTVIDLVESTAETCSLTGVARSFFEISGHFAMNI